MFRASNRYLLAAVWQQSDLTRPTPRIPNLLAKTFGRLLVAASVNAHAVASNNGLIFFLPNAPKTAMAIREHPAFLLIISTRPNVSTIGSAGPALSDKAVNPSRHHSGLPSPQTQSEKGTHSSAQKSPVFGLVLQPHSPISSSSELRACWPPPLPECNPAICPDLTSSAKPRPPGLVRCRLPSRDWRDGELGACGVRSSSAIEPAPGNIHGSHADATLSGPGFDLGPPVTGRSPVDGEKRGNSDNASGNVTGRGS